MLRLRLSESVESFRSTFRQWLSDNPPPDYSGDASLDTFVSKGRAWQQKLASGKWVGVHWPKAYGGRGLSLVEEAVVQEELVRVNSPQMLGLFGLSMVGPVLIEHGTEEQRQRFLSDILSAKAIWCQGFSEPGAGSDLAALKTRARITTDGFVVSGQKTWTSFAHIADWCFLLCRTSDEKKKHQGLSYLLVNMKSPGISTRPLRQITGDEEFNEVFFDDVLVPNDMVVGAVGDGWKIAITTLMYERVVLTFARQLQSEAALRGLLGMLSTGDELLRERLCGEVAEACAIRALAYDHLLDYAEGRSPGPEGSLDKLLWSESFQHVAELALEWFGVEAARSEIDSEIGSTVQRYLYSRGRTIAAGTSEIQRNIIAERVLQLPRLRMAS